MIILTMHMASPPEPGAVFRRLAGRLPVGELHVFLLPAEATASPKDGDRASVQTEQLYRFRNHRCWQPLPQSPAGKAPHTPALHPAGKPGPGPARPGRPFGPGPAKRSGPGASTGPAAPLPGTALLGTAAGLWLGRAKLTGNGGPALLPHGHSCLPVTPELRGTGLGLRPGAGP